MPYDAAAMPTPRHAISPFFFDYFQLSPPPATPAGCCLIAADFR
jgi:hypothetical protein